jgi:dephospho-CoA kinase
MKIIGITGGVASGKSLVTQQFASQGAAVLDADKAGHEALRLPHVEAAARQRWGETVFGADGRIDRAKLARIVFAAGPEGHQERGFLEQLTHPEIGRLLRQQAESFEAHGFETAILDAALLFEAGWNQLCHKIVYIQSPRDERLRRALARGWTREDFEAREAAQDSVDAKQARADVIIDNSTSAERTQAQVEQCWASLIR